MFAATSSWDIVASGGAFNAPPGAAPPDIIDSGSAFSSCERVVLLASPVLQIMPFELDYNQEYLEVTDTSCSKHIDHSL